MLSPVEILKERIVRQLDNLSENELVQIWQSMSHSSQLGEGTPIEVLFAKARELNISHDELNMMNNAIDEAFGQVWDDDAHELD